MHRLKIKCSHFAIFALCVFAGRLDAQNKIPMSVAGGPCFIENKGQIKDQDGNPNKSVKFLLSTHRGMNVLLRSNGFSYDTYQSDDTAGRRQFSKFDKNFPDSGRRRQTKLHFHRVDIELINANQSPTITTTDALPYRFIYAEGSPSGPQNLVAKGYRTISYHNIYPSIDLIFLAAGADTGRTGPEYEFIVHPGGDPNKIRWKYHGSSAAILRGDSIGISVSRGRITERIPKSYQKTEGKKIALTKVRYKTVMPNIFGYSIPSYDDRKDLVIDPTPDLIWGTYYGGEGVDWAYCVARDSLGNVVFGGTAGTSFTGIATAGAYKTNLDGNSDGMIGKFDADGNLLWATYYGGSSYENLWGVAIDRENNIYALGSSFSSDGIATPGAYKTSRTAYNGCTNGYIAKFSPAGQLIWGTYYGGEFDDEPYGITVDHNDDIVICGGTSSMTGIATPGAWQVTFAGGVAGQQVGAEDVFLAKFTTAGTIVWSTYYGGADFDRGNAVAIDPDNNILLTGNAYSTGMSTPGTFQPAMDVPGTQSSFVSKFSASGSLIWGTYFGRGGIPKGGGVGVSIATDKNGSAYVAGFTCCASNISTPGAMQEVSGGLNPYSDGFLVKFDKNGQRLWGTYCGGPSSDYTQGVTCDGSDAVWITGRVASPTNGVTAGAFQPNFTGIVSMYVIKFNGAGAVQWGTYYGNSLPGWYGGDAMAITNDGLGDVYIVGNTSTPSGIATCGAHQAAPAQDGDGFIAKIGPAQTPTVSIAADHNGNICPGTNILVTARALNAGNTPSFQWLLDGKPVSGNASSLSLSNLSSSDSVRCLLILNPACATGAYSSNSLTFQVDPELIPAVAISTASDSVCPGTPVTFNAQGTNGGPQPAYQWAVNGVIQGTDSAGFTTQSLQNGDIVSCKLIHQGSCIIDSIAESNPIDIIVRQPPPMRISIAADQNPVCSGTSVNFTATAQTAETFSYEWEIDGNTAGSNSPSFSSSQLQDGDQIVCLIKTQGAFCTFPAVRSNTVNETVYPTPQVNITGQNSITRGGQAHLNSTISGNVMAFTWTPDSSLNNATILNPIAFPLVTTTYTLKAASDQGCTGEKSFTIEVIPKISIPSAFTPNGDGKNDLFRAVYGSDISEVRLAVYDRWGQLLFIDQGTHQGWNGTFAGKTQPAGTYVWIFEYKESTGISKSLKGTFELVR
jgi:gliding motility-associated-like protein